jgi:hypothetical protein
MNRAPGASDPYVRPALPGDEFVLIPNLRKADREECLALGVPPDQALIESVRISTACFSIVKGDDIIGMFGCGPSPTSDPNISIGSIWLLGSPRIQEIKYTFLRQCKHWTQVLHSDYEVLWNWADSRNDVHLKWLRWLGFKIIKTEAIGVNGETFHQFLSIRSK